MAVYCTATTINEKKAHSQAMGEPGGGGYFLLLTLSELCLLLYSDKLLHTLPGDRQADSREDSYFYTLREEKKYTPWIDLIFQQNLFYFILFYSGLK